MDLEDAAAGMAQLGRTMRGEDPTPDPDSLGAVWALAEAAAEAKGWRLESVHRATYQPQFVGGQNATVTLWEAEAHGPWEGIMRGAGPIPADALRVLIAKLRER